MKNLQELGLVVFTSLISFFAPTGQWILFIGFLVMMDMFSALIAAHKTGKEIESRKMMRTILKFIAYGMAVMCAHYISALFFPTMPILQAISALIATIELKSIDENYKVIFGKSFFNTLISALDKQRTQPKGE